MRLANECVQSGSVAGLSSFLGCLAGWLTLMGLAFCVLPAGAASAREGVSWPEGQALPTFAAARHLDVADIEDIPGDEQLLFATLQGIVNRDAPRLYVRFVEAGGRNVDDYWLDKLSEPGQWLATLNQIRR